LPARFIRYCCDPATKTIRKNIMPDEVRIIYDPADPSPAAKESRRIGLMDHLQARPVSDIEVCDQPWLWPGRIPLGEVTLLVGDPGVGKSLLALDVAARVTQGAPWPDERSIDKQAPGSVILLSFEDRLSTTTRPRLEEAGADCSRIVALPMSVTMVAPSPWSDDGPPKGFELRRDLQPLRRLIHATPDCRLVVIDSMNSYLSENTQNLPADDQRLLVRLVGIAREARVAVVLVTHLRKKGGRAVYCSLGSLAFVAAARAAWAVTKDPESADARLLVPIKNNLAADASGLAFTISSGPIRGAAKIDWSSIPVVAAPDMVVNYSRRNGRPDDERKQAIDWLACYLHAGPRPAREVRQAADANAIGFGTLRRAFRDLHAEAIKESTAHGRWLWRLPLKGAQNPSGEFCASLKNAEKNA
jgi:hypothetical protein